MWAASTWPTRFPFPLRAGVPDNSWMTPGDSNEISRLRASDADRDRAASVINQALADGRLTAEEHAERLDSIYRAKTHAELAPLLDDLPAAGQAAAPQPASAASPGDAAEHAAIVAVFGGASRKGTWRVPRTTTVVTDSGFAVFGGRDVSGDTPESASPDAPVLRLTGACVFGGIGVKRKQRKARRG